MPTEEEVDELLWEKAQQAKDARSGDKSVTERDLKDLLALRDALIGSDAANVGSRGLRFTKLIPPGGGGD